MPERPKDFAVSLDPSQGQSLVRQIAGALVAAMRDGRLRPGMALPGSRQLAEAMGVHRNTVLIALRELELEGFLETRPGSGTFVRKELPKESPRSWGVPHAPIPSSPGFDLPSDLRPITRPVPVQMDLAEGLPDVREAPKEAMAKAYQRAIRLHGEELLRYGEPQGNLAFRQALCELLGQRRGLALDPEQVLVTRGSRMGLLLVAQALLAEGGAVAVEDPGNRTVWESLGQLPGVQLRPVPVDEEGLDAEAFEALLKRDPVRMLYLTPRHQMPTTVALSPRRRKAVLELARIHRVAVVEDDFDAEWVFGGPPALPMAAEDPSGQVVHLGSFSKVLAPGVRLGFLAASRDLVQRLARLRARQDWQGDRVLEWAVADLWRDGDYARHVRRMRQTYEARRDLFAAQLRDRLGDRLRLQVPDGGLSLWVGLEDGPAMKAWVRGCREESLLIHPGSHFDFAGRDLPFSRVGYAALDQRQIDEAADRMARALPGRAS
ncbi:MAG TPA: PLP-dependent aminotransferase family protein [Holophagaceae bacterium]|nr:PLP-dependent aminotransferase family protein [Holophagaceae bacterium]